MSARTFHVGRPRFDARRRENGSTVADTVAPRYAYLTTTVPKEFVHRASIAEVMLTDWERLDDSHFTVAGQWPRRHGFFAAIDDCYDPLLVIETIRQVGILLAHAEFAVPLGHQFLMLDLSVDVRPEHLVIGTTPASVDLEITCIDIKRRGRRLSSLHFEAVIHRDEQVAATAVASFTCTSPAVYQRLRAPRIGDGAPTPIPLTSPTAPQQVGRTSPTDVVLSPLPEPNRWQLRVDTRHPVLFDHPLDHVPGMLLLEAARQAAAAFLGRSCLPVGITGEFSRYAELDAPCVIEVTPLPRCAQGRERLLVTGRQEGALVFTSTVSVAPPRA
ncbi:ScbA/BarX family gamma-butyrolactone biosynthesis protein [Streptomyces tendae]|uniref:ScbA/BarX family gamma-butyrolactone biosynthesis protein n=1 Tax=Streptomyces tendae TaxID=1932 RepID=UPI00369B20BC